MKKLSSLFFLSLIISSCEFTPDEMLSQFIPKPSSPEEETPSQTPALEKNTLSCEEARFVYLLNLYRKSKSLNEVTVSEDGVEGARWMASDMMEKNYFSHIDSAGRSFAERASSFGYPAWSENLAAGNLAAGLTFCQWKNSAGHNTNMLDPKLKTIGIGNAYGSGTYNSYWVNTFGPDTNGIIAQPLTETNCTMPTALPAC